MKQHSDTKKENIDWVFNTTNSLWQGIDITSQKALLLLSSGKKHLVGHG